jgi:hypothetical protein
MASVVQRIFNYFAVALMLVGAAAVVFSNTRVLSPTFMLVAAVPFLVQLLARTPDAPAGLRLAAMALNWIAAVLVGSLAGAALTGIGGAFGLVPIFGSATALYVWNAVSIAIQSI